MKGRCDLSSLWFVVKAVCEPLKRRKMQSIKASSLGIREKENNRNQKLSGKDNKN